MKILTQHGQLDGGLHRFVRVERLVLGLAGVLHVVVVRGGLDAQLGRHRVPFALGFNHLVLDGVWKKEKRARE